jgi:hypothetical protein
LPLFMKVLARMKAAAVSAGSLSSRAEARLSSPTPRTTAVAKPIMRRISGGLMRVETSSVNTSAGVVA